MKRNAKNSSGRAYLNIPFLIKLNVNLLYDVIVAYFSIRI